MADEDDLPRSFELLIWGAQHPRMISSLGRAKLPPGVAASAGPLGAVLKIPLFTDSRWLDLLFGRIERAQKEGGLFVGLLPDHALSSKVLREEWQSAVRTRLIAVKLTPKAPTVTLRSVAPDWGLDDF